MQDEKVLEVDGGDRGTKQCEHTRCHRTAHLEMVAMVRAMSCYYRSQFKKIKMKKSTSCTCVRISAMKQTSKGRGGPGLGSGLARRRSEEALVRATRAWAAGGDPAPGSGDTGTASLPKQAGRGLQAFTPSRVRPGYFGALSWGGTTCRFEGVPSARSGEGGREHAGS